MKPNLRRKLEKLEAILRDLERVLVAFSGGVDSSFLLAVAVDVLGRDNVLAVTARSPTTAAEEPLWARRLARACKARHLTLESTEFSDAAFLRNAPDRCYHCKRVRFGALVRLAADRGFSAVVDGTNADDARDYRPGMKAVAELGVRSPLREAGLTKAEIREASRRRGLAGASRPAAACLASRVPYGEELAPEKLAMIDAAERYLSRLGFSPVRVRAHELGPKAYLARIEAPVGNLRGEVLRKIQRRLRRLGFLLVTLDLAGYRTGSLNALAGRPRRGAGRRR